MTSSKSVFGTFAPRSDGVWWLPMACCPACRSCRDSGSLGNICPTDLAVCWSASQPPSCRRRRCHGQPPRSLSRRLQSVPRRSLQWRPLRPKINYFCAGCGSAVPAAAALVSGVFCGGFFVRFLQSRMQGRRLLAPVVRIYIMRLFVTSA